MKVLSYRTARVAVGTLVVTAVAAIGLISPAAASAREAGNGKAVTVVHQTGTAKPSTRVVNAWEW